MKYFVIKGHGMAKKTKIYFLLIGLALVLQANPVFCVELTGLRSWPAPDNTRIVFDLSDKARYHLFMLEKPLRLVIDFKDGRLRKPLALPEGKAGVVRRMRSSLRKGKVVRVVFDLRDRPQVHDFQLPPTGAYGHRLVLDLRQKTADEKPARPVEPEAVPPRQTLARQRSRNVIIAIDAGHGGEDPGAIGHRGVREKDVVMAIARRLAGYIDKESGMQAAMVRDGDYYISLRERIRRARAARADLFISIHADSFHDRRAHGASIYILSPNGATDEMSRWLAEKENGADLIGGVRLDDKDDALASVLLDLSQNASIEASYEAANDVLKAFRPLLRMHKKEVQRAGFVVLKAPDVPSMLVETAFITNPRDERRLNTPSEQARIARAMLKGVRRFFTQRPPEGTVFAARRHTIARGDTLSELAAQYHVSIANLRSANGLKGDRLRIGQVIRIPGLNTDG